MLALLTLTAMLAFVGICLVAQVRELIKKSTAKSVHAGLSQAGIPGSMGADPSANTIKTTAVADRVNASASDAPPAPEPAAPVSAEPAVPAP